MPKGYKTQKTLTKEAGREILRQLVLRRMQELGEAQIANALGIKYLVTREKKTGKFIRVTEAMARAKVGDDQEIIEVWEKDPAVQAWAGLMNYTIDKPAEQPQEVAVKGTLRITWAQT